MFVMKIQLIIFTFLFKTAEVKVRSSSAVMVRFKVVSTSETQGDKFFGRTQLIEMM